MEQSKVTELTKGSPSKDLLERLSDITKIVNERDGLLNPDGMTPLNLHDACVRRSIMSEEQSYMPKKRVNRGVREKTTEAFEKRERVTIEVLKPGEGISHIEWLKQNNLLMSEKDLEDFKATHKCIGDISLLE